MCGISQYFGLSYIQGKDWRLIAVATLLPCGIHFAMGISALRIFFLDDPLWQPPIDGARWGLFQGILTVPNLLLPVIGGLFMDILHKTFKGTQIFLIFTVLGQWLFTLGVYLRSYPVTIGGRLLFGFGSGGVSCASGAILAKGLQNRNRLNLMAAAVGITESFHALSTLTSAALPVYVVQETGEYWTPMALGGVACTLCLILGCAGTIADVEQPHLSRYSARQSFTVRTINTTRSIPFILIPLLGIHFCASGAHRLFGHVDSAFFYSEYRVDVKEAGLMAGFTSLFGVFVPPLLGCIFFSTDNAARYPALALSLSTFFGAIGYFMLSYGADPGFPLLALSLCNACTPTLLKALVAIMVPSSSLATAYGMFGASESLVKTVGSVAVGILRDVEGGYAADVAIFGVLLVVASVASAALAVFGRVVRIDPRNSPTYAWDERETLLNQ